jgi:hypothetical protein
MRDERGEQKWHWYAFSFIGPTSTSNSTYASCYFGFPNKAVTKSRIKEAKRGADVLDGAVMLSCCYLGCMKQSEFEGEEA